MPEWEKVKKNKGQYSRVKYTNQKEKDSEVK
jgi:hypothetical protein